MRLTNYEFAQRLDKTEWLNSIETKVGLKYFGGKTFISKYIFNNIANMAVQMKKDGKKADIFIDAFTGGGKIGLSIPYGWFNTIVMNDLNYGVYSYYKCCQNNYIDLMHLIEAIGDIWSRELFELSLIYLNPEDFDLTSGKIEKPDELIAGALTFWTTYSSFNGMTSIERADYILTQRKKDDKGNKTNEDDRKMEQEGIKRVIRTAYRNIPKIHQQLNQQHYIIENLDYKELIKKYNGKEYSDVNKNKHEAEEKYKEKNKLYYFDPPYFPWSLWGGKDAPYEFTFSDDMSYEMLRILAGFENSEYGEIPYFIKSDYDYTEAYRNACDKGYVDKLEENDDNEALATVNKIKEFINRVGKDEIEKTFNKLEEYPYCKINVGSFDKGVVLKKGATEKSKGEEYVWCRGFPKDYDKIEGEPAKEKVRI
jgi:site-specific DNA-adenine methylase